MKHLNKFWAVSLLAVCIYGFGSAGSVRAETLKIGGTGFGLGVMKKLAEAFENSHPGETIQILPSLGSSGGIKALLHGALDLAISGRPLRESELGRGVDAHVLSMTPFIFIVHKKVSQKGIRLRELEQILRGDTRTWPDGTRIRPVLRPETDSVARMLRKISNEMDQAVTVAMARKGMIMAITDQESAETVEKTPGALGAGTLTQVISEQRRVGILSLNGVRPSVQCIGNGTYPLSLPLYLAAPIEMPASSRKFVDFIYSEDGRGILAENGNMVVRN